MKMKYLKKEMKFIFGFIFIFLSLFITSHRVESSEFINWQEVSQTNESIIYIDVESIKYKNNILNVDTKLDRIDTENNQAISSETVKFQIDCSNRLYKDGVNKWKTPVNKLIKQAIINSCLY